MSPFPMLIIISTRPMQQKGDQHRRSNSPSAMLNAMKKGMQELDDISIDQVCIVKKMEGKKGSFFCFKV